MVKSKSFRLTAQLASQSQNIHSNCQAAQLRQVNSVLCKKCDGGRLGGGLFSWNRHTRTPVQAGSREEVGKMGSCRVGQKSLQQLLYDPKSKSEQCVWFGEAIRWRHYFQTEGSFSTLRNNSRGQDFPAKIFPAMKIKRWYLSTSSNLFLVECWAFFIQWHVWQILASNKFNKRYWDAPLCGIAWVWPTA